MGRRQKPIDEKIKTGAGRRSLPTVEAISKKDISKHPQAWLQLSDEAAKVWDRLVDKLAVRGFYDELDEPAFARYCAIYAWWQSVQNQLNELDKMVTETESKHVTMYRITPLVPWALRFDAALKDHEKNFAMNPAARQAMVISQHRSGGDNKDLFGHGDPEKATNLPVGSMSPSRLN